MSELIVIGYDNPVQARSAYDEVITLQSDFIANVRGLAIVTVDDQGKSHVETPQKIVGIGAASGALWGMLIGLLFFVPFLGAALGGALGALFGKLAKSGINDTFRQQVQELLQPGKAAVVIMAEKITEDKSPTAWPPTAARYSRHRCPRPTNANSRTTSAHPPPKAIPPASGLDREPEV